MPSKNFIDQIGHSISLAKIPERIISLVPSQTELLYDLGLEERIVGLTKFCVHPNQAIKSKTIIGGTKDFYLDIINQLEPDLIIGNKEENYVEGIVDLQKKFPVWTSNIVTREDAIQMIESIAEITETFEKGSEIIGNIEKAFRLIKPLNGISTLYLMWRKPWMGAANHTFIHSMMAEFGMKNVLADQNRYPSLSAEQLKSLDPKLVLLSSEPFPFAEKHIQEIREILPLARVKLVDGEMFSWYGSRLALAPAYFNSQQFPD